MKSPIPAIVLLALALSACDADRVPVTDDAAMPPVADQPAQDVPPANAPPPPEDASALPAGDARLDGYGDMRFGMTAAEAKKAWGGELEGDPAEGETCFHLSPKWVKAPAEFAFMFENDKFVRYSTDRGKQVAPGGGKVGMTAVAIKQLYSGRVEEQPHEYVEGGRYLRIEDDASEGVVLFETDERGVVAAWRVGIEPQIDYVEGCS